MKTTLVIYLALTLGVQCPVRCCVIHNFVVLFLLLQDSLISSLFHGFCHIVRWTEGLTASSIQNGLLTELHVYNLPDGAQVNYAPVRP